MPRLRSWIYLFTILVMVISACAPLPAADIGPSIIGDGIIHAEAVPGSPTPELVETTQPVVNECLECHADKDRLIETAEDVEEIAESESRGVG